MNKNGKISASMMCSSLGKLPDTIHLFEEENIDYLHIDVMDGNFVTNMGYGTSYVKHMRDVTDIPLDIHLMITNPEYKLEWFDLQPTDIVSIHAESTQDIKGAIEAVKSYGCKCTVAINPITPIDAITSPSINCFLLSFVYYSVFFLAPTLFSLPCTSLTIFALCLQKAMAAMTAETA